MKIAELRGLTPADLNNKVVAWEEELFRMRCQKKTGGLEDTSTMSKTRKMIARAKTILNEKQNADQQ